MDIFQSIILGIIEGFTEFLPISSTGHLIVASEFLGLEQTNVNKAFEVIIQFAAILAVVLNYKDKFSLSKIELWKKLILAFIPLGAVGFVFSHQIKELFSVEIVAIMFIVGGVVFLIVERFYTEKNTHIQDLEQVSYKQALYIGIAQIFALIPGTSRAGSTIIGAMLVGLSRKASAEFSFLLAFRNVCNYCL
jgi:undecaprenyl-diphosphatase